MRLLLFIHLITDVPFTTHQSSLKLRVKAKSLPKIGFKIVSTNEKDCPGDGKNQYQCGLFFYRLNCNNLSFSIVIV
jgi:hypothetical protein